jgi:large subunit ribosomal protein L17
MRHRKHKSKLNRTSEHRLALMRNLAVSLVREERIRTTQVKAMQLRGFVEPLVTLAKNGTLHDRRSAFARLGKKEAVHKLFEEIGPRVGERPGGYVRVVKDGPRAGDGALMAYVEFVDAAPAKAPESLTLEQTIKKKRHEQRKARRKSAAT